MVLHLNAISSRYKTEAHAVTNAAWKHVVRYERRKSLSALQKKVSLPMWEVFRFRENDSITTVCRTYWSTVSVKWAIPQTVHPPLSLSSCRFCHCTDSKLYYFASTESGNVTLMLWLLTADAFLLYLYLSVLFSLSKSVLFGYKLHIFTLNVFRVFLSMFTLNGAVQALWSAKLSYVIYVSFILNAGGHVCAESPQMRLTWVITYDAPGNPLYGQTHHRLSVAK